MNGKRAKQIRRIAKENARKEGNDFGYVETVRHIPTKKRTAGKSYQIVAVPGTVRREQQDLKRAFKKSRSN